MKREREGEAKNPGPEGEEGGEQEAAGPRQEVIVRQFNVAHFDKNGGHMLLQEADVMGIAEHKLNDAQMSEWKARF